MSVTTFGFGAIEAQDGTELVVLREEQVRPLASLLDGTVPASVRELLPAWDDWVERVVAALEEPENASEGWTPQDDVSFAPPLDDPSAVYCAGANFYDHIIEMKVEAPDKATDQIFHFCAPPASMTGHGQPVYRPKGVERLDWEVELVGVIGRTAYRVTADEALEYVAGYTVSNDISVREASIFHPIFGVRWVPSKTQATMNPIGPAIVPRSLVGDPMRLALSLHVDGALRQSSNTDQMIWTLQEQIETLSQMVTLRPGDLILSGTPAGTAAAHGVYLADGDEMVATVEGVGTLVNRVAPAR